MSVDLALSLALQTIAVAVVFTTVRHRRLGYLGVLLLSALVLFHGIGEVLQRLFPAFATYRTLVDRVDIDRFLPYIGAAILAYGLAYALTMKRKPVTAPITQGRLPTQGWWPSWKLAFVGSAPLWLVAAGVATLEGTGTRYWGGGIASQFLVLASGLTAILYVSQSKGFHLLFAILLQSLALSLLGERSNVIAAGLMVLWGLTLLGYRLRWRTLLGLLGVLTMFAIVIVAARADVGRQAFTQGQATTRVSGLGDGISALLEGRARDIRSELVYRIDGNVWPAMVLERQAYTPLAPPEGLVFDLLLAVPQAFNPRKLVAPLTQRNEEYYFDVHYGIPTTVSLNTRSGVDWLPTLFGSALAYGGPLGMILFAAFAGYLLALVDLRLHERLSFTSLLVGLGVVSIVVSYEVGFDGVAITARGVFVIWLVVKVATAIRQRGGRDLVGASFHLVEPASSPTDGSPANLSAGARAGP